MASSSGTGQGAADESHLPAWLEEMGQAPNPNAWQQYHAVSAESQVPESPEQGELREEAGGAGRPHGNTGQGSTREGSGSDPMRRLSKGPRRDRAVVT